MALRGAEGAFRGRLVAAVSGSCVAKDRCRCPSGPPWTELPLCDACLDAAGRDVAALVRDYVDLEQMIIRAGGMMEIISGTPDPSIVIDLGVEALQRDIWLITTTWEEIIRDRRGLSAVPVGAVRDGWAVQRAVRVLVPRLRVLATIEAVSVHPEGPDGPTRDIDGAAAILAMVALHRHALYRLGLTRLSHALPAECPDCEKQTLRRDDGSDTVYCAMCSYRGTIDDYERREKST